MAHRTEARRGHGDRPDTALALHVIERGQKLIVRDHAPADDENLWPGHQAAAARAHKTSAKASSSAAKLSRMAASVITRGGQILIVPPPYPTGLKISSPFSTVRRT